MKSQLEWCFTECVPRYVEECKWTNWLDDDINGQKAIDNSYEYELINDLKLLYDFCERPSDIICALKHNKVLSSSDAGQKTSCSKTDGLRCLHVEQEGENPKCYDYVVRLLCCEIIHYGCEPSTPEPSTTPVPSTTPLVTTPFPTTTAGTTQGITHVISSLHHVSSV